MYANDYGKLLCVAALSTLIASSASATAFPDLQVGKLKPWRCIEPWPEGIKVPAPASLSRSFGNRCATPYGISDVGPIQPVGTPCAVNGPLGRLEGVIIPLKLPLQQDQTRRLGASPAPTSAASDR